MKDYPQAHVPAEKFSDPFLTAKGEARASVRLTNPETLWFNTGTLCNIECTNCYIESSPQNDRLVYLTRAEVESFLDRSSRKPPSPARWNSSSCFSILR